MATSQSLPYPLQQTQLVSQVNQLANIAIIQGNAVTEIMLNSGIPKTFAHGLNRKMQGWFLTDLLSNAVVFRTQPFNANTLTLQSSADTTVSVWCY